MKKQRGWYLRGRKKAHLELIYLLAGPYSTRREAQIWHDGATPIEGLELRCEFIEAKQVDQWRRLGILRTSIYETVYPLQENPYARFLVTRVIQALVDGNITEDQLEQMLAENHAA